MSLDDASLRGLMEESADTHADAMRESRPGLAEVVEHHRDTQTDPDANRAFAAGRREVLRKSLVGVGGVVAAGFGAALLALFDSPAFADQNTDIQMMQTAASIEALAVATYKTALTLPFIGGSSANSVVKAFATMTMDQHSQHLQAFNATATRLGGKPQNNPDPKYAAVVQAALPGIKGPGDVVGLAIKLETVAAQTYVADVGALSDQQARKVTASIMGVEAQHVSILLAVQALLNGGAPQLIALPPNAAALPGAAGSVGFPDSFYKTDQASPAAEGAVA
ncbi:MAG TPA: ferritin-like domain-containing protein [Acidimicrobiales bacterium]|nr:ferritin-like domain-containing protein [Acidimicrobiales bacterium]